MKKLQGLITMLANQNISFYASFVVNKTFNCAINRQLFNENHE